MRRTRHSRGTRSSRLSVRHAADPARSAEASKTTAVGKVPLSPRVSVAHLASSGGTDPCRRADSPLRITVSFPNEASALGLCRIRDPNLVEQRVRCAIRASGSPAPTDDPWARSRFQSPSQTRAEVSSRRSLLPQRTVWRLVPRPTGRRHASGHGQTCSRAQGCLGAAHHLEERRTF